MSRRVLDAKYKKPGAPAWVLTFADLMSLLLCFFILLLSFSQMDVLKYKQVAGSMESAFGVQRVVEETAIPKGTSIIAQEFSPGKPEPTPIKQVQQVTSEDTRQSLRVSDADAASELIQEQLERDARQIAELMVDEIKEGKVDVELDQGRVVIRIRERGSFGSGSADLNPAFSPVIEKIRMVLAEVKGKVEVAGHTDDLPIATERFRSNWELSASRAVSVAHALLETGELDASRFSVNGFGDTQPLAENVDRESRAKNRRVEVVVNKSPADILDDVKQRQQQAEQPPTGGVDSE